MIVVISEIRNPFLLTGTGKEGAVRQKQNPIGLYANPPV